MPARLRRPVSPEHVYGATAAVRQRRFPLKTSYLKRRSASSSTAPGRQQTLTQIAFATSDPRGKYEGADCLDNEEAWEEQRPKKRRRVSERHVKGQQTLTQIDFGKKSSRVERETEQFPDIGAVEDEQIPQETSVCATPSGTTRDRRKIGESTEYLPVNVDPWVGAHLSFKQKQVLDKKVGYEGQQDDSKRETVDDTNPSRYKLRDSTTLNLDLSRKRELDVGRRLMEPPVTPRKPPQVEIPSSQSPSATPLTAHTLVYSTHAQRSPLQEINLNLVPDATSPTKVPTATKPACGLPYKHDPSPQLDLKRSGDQGHASMLASQAESVSRVLKYPADEANKENEDLPSHDKFFEAGADDHTQVSNEETSPTLYRWSGSLDDCDQANDFETGESIIFGPVTQDMRRYELLSRSQRQLMRQTQSRTQPRCMGLPEQQSAKLSNPHSARPTSWPTLHRDCHAGFPIPLKAADCDLSLDAEKLKGRTTPRSRQTRQEVNDVQNGKAAANYSSKPLVPSSQATTLEINPSSPQLPTHRGHVTHKAFTDPANQPSVKSCSPQSRQAFKASSPIVIPSSLPPSLSSSPLQMRSETSTEQLAILPVALSDADLTISQLLPESLMNVVLPPPPVLSQESIEDDEL